MALQIQLSELMKIFVELSVFKNPILISNRLQIYIFAVYRFESYNIGLGLALLCHKDSFK